MSLLFGGEVERAQRERVRVATVFKPLALSDREIDAMDTLRWLRVSEALATAGFRVDMIVGSGAQFRPTHPNLRLVALSEVDWGRYDVVKTQYPASFQGLVGAGGGAHPFIISRVASVVGAHDGVAGVHYFGAAREYQYGLLQHIHRVSRYVSLTTEQNLQVWQREFPTDPGRVLLVPTGVDRVVPSPRRNPYDGQPGTGPIAVYTGHLGRRAQPDLMGWWKERLNRLGRLLRKRGIRLVVIGRGTADGLDPGAVTPVGPVTAFDIWDYQYFAAVGLVLAEGTVQVNDSSKAYYYLRTGLPVVSEAPVPNNDVIARSGCGLIAPYDDDATFVDMVEAAVHRAWDRQAAIDYILAHHTWDHRVATYVDAIVQTLQRSGRG